MAKKNENPALPDDLKDDAANVDPEEPKAVLKIVLDAFERGVKLGKELGGTPSSDKKKSFWY